MKLEEQPQPHDTRCPARKPSRPSHGGWSAMPLMACAPSRPDRAGPAKVIATAVDIVARAVVPARSVIPAKAGIALLRSGSLLSQGWRCSALCVAEDAGRSGIGEAARLREGSAGAAQGGAAIRFPWPWRVFGMRSALPSTGELPPPRSPGGSPRPLSSYQLHPNTLGSRHIRSRAIRSDAVQVPLRKVGAQLRWSKGTCSAALRIAALEPTNPAFAATTRAE